MGIYSFTFSPTGTSAKIIKGINAGISDGLNVIVNLSDLTTTPATGVALGDGDVVIVGAPVYGGRIAPVVKQRFESIEGNGAKCVVVAVYGNRAFENAVNDLAAFMREHGFVVCGAAAFVGEHSYSTPATPIAQGRPDSQDLADAYAYGKHIAAKLKAGELVGLDCSTLKDEPSPAESMSNFKEFVMAYQREQAESPKVYLPVVDMSVCDDCGGCYAVCPTEAITPGQREADPTKCIKCCACVKFCPQNARSLRSPFAEPLSANFTLRKSPRWLL